MRQTLPTWPQCMLQNLQINKYIYVLFYLYSILFCFIVLYSILIYSMLFLYYSILIYSVLFYSILICCRKLKQYNWTEIIPKQKQKYIYIWDQIQLYAKIHWIKGFEWYGSPSGIRLWCGEIGLFCVLWGVRLFLG